MRDLYRQVWHWFWYERTGVLLFPQVRGVKRLIFELPITLGGICAWYLYLFSLPSVGRNWLLAIFLNPLGVVGILCIAAYQVLVSYMRSQLHHDGRLPTRLMLCLFGGTTPLYKRQHGSDLMVKLVDRIRVAGFVSLATAMLLTQWKLFFPKG